MVTKGRNETQPTAVLFSAGLDSAVLLAQAATESCPRPIYVRAGLAWEHEETIAAARLLAAPPFVGAVEELVTLTVDMRDIFEGIFSGFGGGGGRVRVFFFCAGLVRSSSPILTT